MTLASKGHLQTSPYFTMSSSQSTSLTFNGSDWQNLNRLTALAKFQFAQSSDFDNDDGTPDNEARSAWLASHYTGAALDWAASVTTNNTAVMGSFSGFVDATRQAFGIADNNITALLRRDLDQLKWQPNVPVFFAEFDRLTLALGITSHDTRVAIVESKLPHHLKLLLSQQALSFSNYDTMRERFNTMWATDPNRGSQSAPGTVKPKCSNCGKKGHTASDCRKSKN